MKPFLEALVILGKNGTQRRLDFNAGVNIITGVGSKGKSSIFHIFEYCLGSPECRIPVGKVRDFSAWYFLVLNVRGAQVVIGRRAAPSPGRVSDDGYFEYGSAAPSRVETSVLVSNACARLGACLGIPAGAFRLGSTELVYGHITIADLLPFLVQHQHYIASHELFTPPAGRGSQEHRTEVMKIALGIISPDLLSLRAQRDQLQKQKDAVERQSGELNIERKTAMQRFQYLWQRAAQFGLLPDKRVESVEQVRSALAEIREALPTASINANASTQELTELDSQLQASRRTIRRISSDLHQIAELRSASRDVNQSLDAQSARLRAINLLGAPLEDAPPCPLCGSALGPGTEQILSEMQLGLSKDLVYVRSIPPELDATEQNLRQELENEKRKRDEIERQIKDLQGVALAPTLTEERIQREQLIGAFSHELSFVHPSGTHGDLEAESRRIQAAIDEVKERIRALPGPATEEDVLLRLSARMSSLAGEFVRLNLAGSKLGFTPSFSTIERVTDGRRDGLSVLGGAENFVMYHICALLGLHEEFLRGSFVPPILLLDQPSQPFFPTDSDEKQTDRKAILAIYDLLFRFAELQNGTFQVIVLDHADFSGGDDDRFRRAKRAGWQGEDDGLIEPPAQ